MVSEICYGQNSDGRSDRQTDQAANICTPTSGSIKIRVRHNSDQFFLKKGYKGYEEKTGGCFVNK